MWHITYIFCNKCSFVSVFCKCEGDRNEIFQSQRFATHWTSHCLILLISIRYIKQHFKMKISLHFTVYTHNNSSENLIQISCRKVDSIHYGLSAKWIIYFTENHHHHRCVVLMDCCVAPWPLKINLHNRISDKRYATTGNGTIQHATLLSFCHLFSFSYQ